LAGMRAAERAMAAASRNFLRMNVDTFPNRTRTPSAKSFVVYIQPCLKGI